MTTEWTAAVEAQLQSATFLGCRYRAAPRLIALLRRVEGDLTAR